MFVNTDYPMAVEDSTANLLWILIVSLVIAFFLAFGVGANDVANSFGTSVGSKVLTLRQACILATIFEILGAILLGYKVSATIRSGMIHIDQYDGENKLLMLGYLSALIGSSVWNMVATLAGLPVSGTHSIVGAIIGFSIVGKGFGSVKWDGLIKIVASWFISPLASGVVSLILFLIIRHLILNKENSLQRGLISLPIFYSATIFVNVFSIIHEGPHFLKEVNWWMALVISLSLATMIAVIVWFVVVPRLKAKIMTLLNVLSEQPKTVFELPNQLINKSIDTKNASIEMSAYHNSTFQSNEKFDVLANNLSPPCETTTKNDVSDSMVNGYAKHSITKNGDEKNNTDYANVNDSIDDNLNVNTLSKSDPESFEKETISIPNDDDDKPEVAQLFTFLQILTACFGSFAHGGNDVSNAIGPLVAVMLIFKDGTPNGETPWYILLYGGLGISVGLWVWGRRVIKTMGSDLTKITPSIGFTIEIGAAVTVLVASKVGLPISTTHCKVGSVVMVGKAAKSKQGVNWRLFINIAAAWVLTVPLTAAMTAGAMALLKLTI